MTTFRFIWFLCVAISGFMAANWVVFALTGLNLLHPMTDGQGMMQMLVFKVCTVVGVAPLLDD